MTYTMNDVIFPNLICDRQGPSKPWARGGLIVATNGQKTEVLACTWPVLLTEAFLEV